MSTIVSNGTVPVWGLTSPQEGSASLLVNSYSQNATSQKYEQPDGNGETQGVIYYAPSMTATLDGAVAADSTATAIAPVASVFTLADINPEVLMSFYRGEEITFTARCDSNTQNRTAGGAMTQSLNFSVYPF